ncbi:MAG: lipocalin family protein [Thermoanaerobaculia bacterium]|nr:lipocalin family protein [Thermoanaerobaculia bacterium]
MNHRFLYPLIVCVAFVLAGCQPENDKNTALIGKWQGTEWLIFDEPSGQDAAKVYFEFRPDGSYEAGMGAQSEKGVWRTAGDKLYTTAEGRKEIMVKMLEASPAVLKFEMNRGGQQETLILKKVQ